MKLEILIETGENANSVLSGRSSLLLQRLLGKNVSRCRSLVGLRQVQPQPRAHQCTRRLTVIQLAERIPYKHPSYLPTRSSLGTLYHLALILEKDTEKIISGLIEQLRNCARKLCNKVSIDSRFIQDVTKSDLISTGDRDNKQL